MKKTVAMIYRFIFILFSVWGISQKVGFNILSFTPAILNFTLFVDILSFICIFAVFIINITRSPGRFICGIKAVLTLAAILVFISNLPIFSTGITYDWILGILLPLMMFIDWLVFDKKGDFRFYDPLIWLVGVILLGALLSFLLNSLFGVGNIFSEFGIFDDFEGLLSLLIKALGIGVAMYLFDCLASAFKKKSTKNAISLIYRLLFILLEIFAFINLIGRELTDLIYNLRYYHILSNFICTVCIAVTIVYNLVKHHSLKKSSTPFPRFKAGFTIVLIVTMIGNILWGKEIWYLSFSELVIFVIAPVMMLFDWILFDFKGALRIFDPLLWSLMPFGYYACSMTFFGDVAIKYNKIFSLPQPEMILCSLGVIIVMGYILYLVDKVSSR